MKNLNYSKEIESIVTPSVWGVLDGIFIKRKKDNSYIDTLEAIDKNKNKLTLDNYAMFDRFYIDESGIIRAFGGIFHSDYITFKEFYLDSNIDKKKVLRNLVKCICELESIGISYTDIHSENIIVNSNSDMRLVDLDEAFLDGIQKSSTLLLDIIIESLVLYDFNDTALLYTVPRYIIQNLSSNNILSENLLLALNGVQSESSFFGKVESYIEELSDIEKTSILRKELVNTKPEYF